MTLLNRQYADVVGVVYSGVLFFYSTFSFRVEQAGVREPG